VVEGGALHRTPMPHAVQRRLDSWKAIAEYLGRDVRTVIRWEHERRLPVRRVPGAKRSAVFAHADEIDRWLLAGSRETPAGTGGESRTAVQPGGPAEFPGTAGREHDDGDGGVAPAESGNGAATRTRASRRVPSEVVRISLSGHQLVAFGPEDAVLWAHHFTEQLAEIPDSDCSGLWASADLDGDGHAEYLVGVPYDNRHTPKTAELYCYSRNGRVRWSRTLSDEIAFGARRFGPPWNPPTPYSRSVAVYRVDGRTRIAWVTNSTPWWPCVLSILDEEGRFLSKWIHSGVIHTIASFESVFGPVLLVAGTSNSRGAAFLAVLDARNVAGTGPEEAGSPYECLSCPPGHPLRYFGFPPSDLNAAARDPYNRANAVVATAEGFEVMTNEAFPPVCNGHVRFDRDLGVRSLAWSDGCAPFRERAEAQGLVRPLKGPPPPPRVLSWDPSGKWTELTPVAQKQPLASAEQSSALPASGTQSRAGLAGTTARSSPAP
jgi:hypothetical protein